MEGILKEGPRLRLRRAGEADIDYICDLQVAKDNSDYIVPFSRTDHESIIMQAKASMDIISMSQDCCSPRRSRNGRTSSLGGKASDMGMRR